MSATVTTLRLDGEMNIYHAAELKQMLLEPLKDGITLEVDLSAVTDIDTAGLQLLMLTKKTAQAGGGEVRLLAHSAPVLDAIELLNLAGHFGDPLVIASRTAFNPGGR